MMLCFSVEVSRRLPRRQVLYDFCKVLYLLMLRLYLFSLLRYHPHELGGFSAAVVIIVFDGSRRVGHAADVADARDVAADRVVGRF